MLTRLQWLALSFGICLSTSLAASGNARLDQLQQLLEEQPQQLVLEVERLLPQLNEPDQRHQALLLKARAERQ